MVLSGLTITGGLTTAAEASGGGIRFLANGSLTLRDSVVDNNHTRGDNAQGGGIYSTGRHRDSRRQLRDEQFELW